MRTSKSLSIALLGGFTLVVNPAFAADPEDVQTVIEKDRLEQEKAKKSLDLAHREFEQRRNEMKSYKRVGMPLVHKNELTPLREVKATLEKFTMDNKVMISR